MLAKIEQLMFAKIVPIWVLLLGVVLTALGVVGLATTIVLVERGEDLGLAGRIARKIGSFPLTLNAVVQEVSGSDVSVSHDIPIVDGIEFFGDPVVGLIAVNREDKDYGYLRVALVDLESGNEVHSWRALPKWLDKLQQDAATKTRGGIGLGYLDITRGELITTIGQEGRLIKVDANSDLVWENSELRFHHLINVDREGNIWVPTEIGAHPLLSKFEPNYRDDGFAKISKDGKVLIHKSVSDILIENDLEHLLFLKLLEPDQIHLNSVDVAESTNGIWNKGDVLLSIRHLSMVLLYRPVTNKIIWHRIGPWLNQHDAEFLDSEKISVFGNDVVSTSVERTTEKSPYRHGHNEIYIVNPMTDEVTTPYSTTLANRPFNTVTGGQVVYSEGDLMLVHYDNQAIAEIFSSKGEPLARIARLNTLGRAVRGSSMLFEKRELPWLPVSP